MSAAQAAAGDGQTIQEVLKSAIAIHQAGQLEQACALYEKVLSQDGANASALQLFGALRHQQGDDPGAIELIGRALALRPNMPVVHANLAEAYRASGKLERALGCCRTALKLWPNCPELLCNLGLTLHLMGLREEAAEQFRRALGLKPDFAPVHNGLGIVLRELGHLDEALEHFRRAVAGEPSFVPALANLSRMLVDRGEAAEALPHCNEAVRLQPDVAALHYNLGNALGALGRWAESRAAFLEALRLDPELAPAYAHLGLTLQRECRLGDALPWLKQAVESDPNSAEFRQLLGDLYAEWEQPVEAIPCYERALALDGANRPALRLSLGQALLDEGRLPEAEEQYGAALKLSLDAAVVHLHLGGLYQVRGELSNAETAFRQAIRLRPLLPGPHALVATLLGGNLPDADLAALEERLADASLGAELRARLLFALAHVLDARGDYARAACSLREANSLALTTAKGFHAYDPSLHAACVDSLVAALDRDFHARTAGLGLETSLPVFVFGLPRSGTTLVEQILCSHSACYGAGELRVSDRTLRAVPAAVGQKAPPLECAAALDRDAIRRLAHQHLDALRKASGEQPARVVDKMPDNYLYLGFLAALFPKATFIHCTRDLRDVGLSCWMTDFRMVRWANDPDHIATRFREYRRLMEHWREVLPVPLHEVSYEETVADLECVARRLIAACGLDWQPACLDFHRNPRPVHTASAVQVRKPIYATSVGRWKNYESELADLFAGLPLDGAAGAETGLAHDGAD